MFLFDFSFFFTVSFSSELCASIYLICSVLYHSPAADWWDEFQLRSLEVELARVLSWGSGRVWGAEGLVVWPSVNAWPQRSQAKHHLIHVHVHSRFFVLSRP